MKRHIPSWDFYTITYSDGFIIYGEMLDAEQEAKFYAKPNETWKIKKFRDPNDFFDSETYEKILDNIEEVDKEFTAKQANKGIVNTEETLKEFEEKWLKHIRSIKLTYENMGEF